MRWVLMFGDENNLAIELTSSAKHCISYYVMCLVLCMAAYVTTLMRYHGHEQNIDNLHKKRLLKQQEAARKAEAWRQHIIAMQQQQRLEQEGAVRLGEGGEQSAGDAEEVLQAIYPGLASSATTNGEHMEGEGRGGQVEGGDDASRSKRRRTSGKVDYVALNKEL